MDDKVTGRKEFVGYIEVLGGILPFRATEREQGIGLVQSQWVLSWDSSTPLEPKGHYCVHYNFPPVSILQHFNPVHNLSSHFKTILILSFHLNLHLPSGHAPQCHACYMPLPTSCSLFHHPNNSLWREQIMKCPDWPTGPTQPPGASSPEVKQLGHEAYHSCPSSAMIRNAWSYTSTPSIAFIM